MREYSLNAKLSAIIANHFFAIIGIVCVKADSVHAGIKRENRLYTFVRRAQFFNVAFIDYRLRDVILRQLFRAQNRSVAQDKDLPPDSGKPKLYRFVNRRHRKIFYAGFLQDGGDVNIAVSVCVGFYNRHDLCTFRKTIFVNPIIVYNRAKVYFCPASFVSHQQLSPPVLALYNACISIISRANFARIILARCKACGVSP